PRVGEAGRHGYRQLLPPVRRDAAVQRQERAPPHEAGPAVDAVASQVVDAVAGIGDAQRVRGEIEPGAVGRVEMVRYDGTFHADVIACADGGVEAHRREVFFALCVYGRG